jgi:hypothetical protein
MQRAQLRVREPGVLKIPDRIPSEPSDSRGLLHGQLCGLAGGAETAPEVYPLFAAGSGVGHAAQDWPTRATSPRPLLVQG